MATVELSFTALPAHVRTARLVATAVARRSGVDESLLDEVRLAVGEACSRAVEGHQLYCPAEPVRLALTEAAGRFEVEVTDTCAPAGRWPGGPARAEGDSAAGGRAEGDRARGPSDSGTAGSSVADPRIGAGLGIAVIEGLADDVEIRETADGTSIRMSWPLAEAAR
ncbi:MAG TPA: ATP-binding protein [Streptosporangiaceae bacterium]|nr:ATP-binding protein [Streptosporangiaceae bacterium]